MSTLLKHMTTLQGIPVVDSIACTFWGARDALGLKKGLCKRPA